MIGELEGVQYFWLVLQLHPSSIDLYSLRVHFLEWLSSEVWHCHGIPEIALKGVILLGIRDKVNNSIYI